MAEKLNLRCYGCNHEFVKEIDVKEFISEINCPNCKENKVEINLGEKIKE